MAFRFAIAVLGLMVLIAAVPAANAQKPAGVIDSADSEWSDVQTELLEVKRMSDNTVRVRWRWRNSGDKDTTVTSGETWNILKEWTYVLDPTNKKKHFVVTDAKGAPISTEVKNFKIPAKGSFSAWAKFPAPPANVDKITVVIAKTPPFEDVPISK